MIQIGFTAMPSAVAQRFRESGLDDYGQPVLRWRSQGEGAPCRHCLQEVAAGDEFLALAYRPFAGCHAYAETGPVFIHSEHCERYQAVEALPAMFRKRGSFLMRAYDRHDRIMYGSAAHVPVDEIIIHAERLLSTSDTAYVHLRSGLYNCFQCRIDRLSTESSNPNHQGQSA